MTTSDQPSTANDEAPRPGTDQPAGDPREHAAVSRRTMLRGVTVGGLSVPLLAACGGGGDSAGSASDASSAASASSSASASGSAAASAGGSAGTTLAVSDVPVGGGAVFPDDELVVTQPSEGEFKAFDATCTHQGCLVNKVEDEQIVCPCHGSHFSITDGSPVAGPAKAALAAKKVSVKGTKITVT